MGRIDFECPDCGKKLGTSAEKTGRRAKCPGCGGIISIPAVTGDRAPGGREIARPEPLPNEQAIGSSDWLTHNALSEGEPAAVTRRLFEFLIDLGAITCLNMLLGLALRLAVVVAGVDASQLPHILLVGLSVGLCLTYYAVSEGTVGQTPGKMLLRTKVVRTSGSSVRASDAIVRTMVRLVPFEALSILSNSRLMWHDKWSRTKVVDTAPLSVWRQLTIGAAVVASTALWGWLRMQTD